MKQNSSGEENVNNWFCEIFDHHNKTFVSEKKSGH